MGKTIKLTTRLSQSAYLRKLIRGYVPKAYPPETFYELMGRLNEKGGITLEAVRQLQETVTAPEKIE